MQQALWVPGAALTSFALAGGIQVVVGAQQLALAVDAAVVDAGREVGAQIDLSCHIGARLEPEVQKGVSPRPSSSSCLHQRHPSHSDLAGDERPRDWASMEMSCFGATCGS